MSALFADHQRDDTEEFLKRREKNKEMHVLCFSGYLLASWLLVNEVFLTLSHHHHLISSHMQHLNTHQNDISEVIFLKSPDDYCSYCCLNCLFLINFSVKCSIQVCVCK